MKILKIVAICILAAMLGATLMSVFFCVYHIEETPIGDDDMSKILLYVYANEFGYGHDMPVNARLESIGRPTHDEYHNRDVYGYILIEPDIACYYVEAWQEDGKWYGDVIKQL